jgi:hypothetical protein
MQARKLRALAKKQGVTVSELIRRKALGEQAA